MTEPRRVEDALADDAIQDLIHEISGGDDGLLLRWVVVAETMSDDGSRRLIHDYQDQMQDWEVRGLLHAALRDETWQEESE